MKGRFQVEATGTLANLNQFRTLLEDQLSSDDVFDRPFDWAREGNTVVLHVRIQTREQAETLFDWFRDNRAIIANNLNGKASFHVCGHDEIESWDCKMDQQAHYREIAF